MKKLWLILLLLIYFLVLIYFNVGQAACGESSNNTETGGEIVFIIASKDGMSKLDFKGQVNDPRSSYLTTNGYVNSIPENGKLPDGSDYSSKYGKTELSFSSDGCAYIKAAGSTYGESTVKSDHTEGTAIRKQSFEIDYKGGKTLENEQVTEDGYTSVWTKDNYIGSEVHSLNNVKTDIPITTANTGSINIQSHDSSGGNKIESSGTLFYCVGPGVTATGKAETWSQIGTDPNGGVWASAFLKSIITTK